jgi:hypothetical protein
MTKSVLRYHLASALISTETPTPKPISSNGFITFNNSSADGCCSGQPLPTVPFTANVPSNIVAGLWTDLNNPQGNIRYETLGVPGSLEFVVGFYNDQFCCGSGVANTFEMILHEGSNAIELQYGTLGVSPSGLIVSSGIENDGGTIGLQVFNGVSGTTEQAALQNRGFLISQTGAARTYNPQPHRPRTSWPGCHGVAA